MNLLRLTALQRSSGKRSAGQEDKKTHAPSRQAPTRDLESLDVRHDGCGQFDGFRGLGLLVIFVWRELTGVIDLLMNSNTDMGQMTSSSFKIQVWSTMCNLINITAQFLFFIILILLVLM